MKTTDTKTHFDVWLDAARVLVHASWESWLDASAARRAGSAPTLLQMEDEYEAAKAALTGDLDLDGDDAVDVCEMSDAITGAYLAEGSFDECLSYQLDRMFALQTFATRLELQSKLIVSLN